MKIVPVAITLIATALASTANAQTSGPPGGAIEHVGPLATSPQAQAPTLTVPQKALFLEAVISASKSRITDNVDVAVGDPLPPIDLHLLPAEVLAQAFRGDRIGYTIRTR